LILAIDIGTSSVRAALYDSSGNIIPRSLVKLERKLRNTADGGSEIDADKALLQLIATVDKVLSISEKSARSITHVAICSFWHSLVGIDANGNRTTKLLGWADNRSRDHVAVLRKRLDETEIHNRTGARFHSSFWPAKLLWVRESQPDAFARTEQWLSLSDYVALKLFGDASTSISMASATGLFDIRQCSWDGPLARFLKIKRISLPPIADVNQRFRLNKKFARRWPRLAQAEWFPAIGDGAANNIGSACVSTDRAALMIGTSGALRVAYRGRPPGKVPSGLWCYRIDGERVIIGGALSDGGGLYDWLKTSLRLPANAERHITQRPPAAHGLTFLPFVAGERSTGYHENARGGILGLTSATDSIDIAQAAMEAVGYRFAEIFDQLGEVADVKAIFASGGALRASTVWAQIISDILGRKITLINAPEASLRGAVLLALETIGNIESIEEISPGRGTFFEPDKSHSQAYQAARTQHRTLYEVIVGKY
jgi:gluconokinase